MTNHEADGGHMVCAESQKSRPTTALTAPRDVITRMNVSGAISSSTVDLQCSSLHIRFRIFLLNCPMIKYFMLNTSPKKAGNSYQRIFFDFRLMKRKIQDSSYFAVRSKLGAFLKAF